MDGWQIEEHPHNCSIVLRHKDGRWAKFSWFDIGRLRRIPRDKTGDPFQSLADFIKAGLRPYETGGWQIGYTPKLSEVPTAGDA